jgi:hypothetical protein
VDNEEEMRRWEIGREGNEFVGQPMASFGHNFLCSRPGGYKGNWVNEAFI